MSPPPATGSRITVTYSPGPPSSIMEPTLEHLSPWAPTLFQAFSTHSASRPALMPHSSHPELAPAPDSSRYLSHAEAFQGDIPRALLEAIRESVIYTDLEGRIMYWNAGATRIFGYSGFEMMGRSPALLYPDEDPQRLAADLRQVMEGRDYSGEWLGRRKDGSYVWVDITTTLVRGPGGEPTGFLGIAKDITERKRAEGDRDRAR